VHSCWVIPRAFVAALVLYALQQGAYALQQGASAPPRTDTSVDLQQFGGTYYEIARSPNHFQTQCVGDVTVNYTVRTDGRLEVLNRCRRENGTIAQVRGVGRPGADGRIEVQFAAPWLSLGRRRWGNYVILAAGPDYSYAVIGWPRRDYLWILSRLPRMPQLAYKQALEIAKAYGYDVDRLIQNPEGDRGSTEDGFALQPTSRRHDR
jgi:apolipoprotein D and lipocalin family protein